MMIRSLLTRPKFAFAALFALLVPFVLYVFTGSNGREDSPRSKSGESNRPNWNDFDVNRVPAGLVMDYFNWRNQSSCRLFNHFGGIMVNQTMTDNVYKSFNEPITQMDLRGPKSPVGYDGSYAVCLDPPSVAPIPGKCLVYSFGSLNEFTFEDMFERYGCQVITFDPTLGKGPYNRTVASQFYDWGITHTKDKSSDKYLPLSTIYKRLEPFHGPDAIIDYVKLDIELYEVGVIPDIIQSGMLNKIRQLSVELHMTDWRNHTMTYFRHWISLPKMLEDAGMFRFHSEPGPLCPMKVPLLQYEGYVCYIISWYNSRFLSKPSIGL